MIKTQIVIWIRTCLGSWSQCVSKMCVPIYQITNHHNTENNLTVWHDSVIYRKTLFDLKHKNNMFLSTQLFRVSSMTVNARETRSNYTFPKNTLNPLSPNTEYFLVSASWSNTMHILIQLSYVLMFRW
jgi:hypothetical protein